MQKKIGWLPIQLILAWAVHLLTASASFAGLLTLIKIYQHQYVVALWLMALTILIDAIDGSLARWVGVKTILPSADGALLDNIVDYLNYVITPCFFLYVKADMLPDSYRPFILFAIVISSSYQFCQTDAKTTDHFFKGFPSYWNIVVFYMFIFSTSMTINALVLTALCLLVFIPIKYVYPSRLDYLTSSHLLRILMHLFSCISGLSSVLLLWTYPTINPFFLGLSIAYVVLYVFLSIYRNYSPMILSEVNAHKD